MNKISERYINQSGTDEKRSFFHVAPPMPKNMMVELTNACNHACIFCTNPHMQRKTGRMDGDFLAEIMADARKEGVEEIGFYTTGDPFVHKDLEKFTMVASALGFSYIYISTNGALATPTRSKAVIDAGMSSIKFSINAGTRDTYARVHGKDDFEKIMSHLKFISDYRREIERPLKLFVTCILTDLSRQEVTELEDRVGDLVDEIMFVECGTQSGQMSQANALLGVTENNFLGDNGTCPQPFNRLHVTHEGYLTLCCVDYQNYLAIADLNKIGLRDAWHGEDFKEARRKHIEKDLAGTLCGNCWLNRQDDITPLKEPLAAPFGIDEHYSASESVTRSRISDSPETLRATADSPLENI